MMTSRERIIKTLNHQQPDRIPFDLGSTLVTGITKNAYINLAAVLKENPGKIELCDTIQQLPVVSENILKELDVDTRGLIPNFTRKNPELKDDGDCFWFTDEWGVKWKMPKGSLYFSVEKSPFSENISEKEIDDFRWPDPEEPALLEGLQEKAQRYHQQGYAVILENLCAGIFEMSCRVRGTEQFCMDLAMNPEIASKLLDKFVELKIRFYKAALEKLGNFIQLIREGDDMAGQEALLISPQMYRNFLKPRHKQLFEAQRRFFSSPFYTFFHSDGAIYDIIPDFIEIGIDILNPVQLTAKGMDAEKLKKEYGQDLSFWGGGVDTQHILPTANPKQVRGNVEERIRCFAPGVGFIFGAVHNIQDDVPAENILAMVGTFKKLRNY
jgi:uroporphyrinogen decarboxylase